MKRILSSMAFLLILGTSLVPSLVFADAQTVAAAVCEGQGLNPGTPAYDTCVAEEAQIIEDQDAAEAAAEQAAAEQAAAEQAAAEQAAADQAAFEAEQAAATLENANNPNIIDLNDGGDVNDSHSFNIGKILQAEGQDTEQFLDAEEGPVIAFLIRVINFITLIIGSIAMLLIIVGGLLMVASEGNEDRIQKGKDIVVAAIIGLVISMASYMIVAFVQSIFY